MIPRLAENTNSRTKIALVFFKIKFDIFCLETK
jgi:hypothetical protein